MSDFVDMFVNTPYVPPARKKTAPKAARKKRGANKYGARKQVCQQGHNHPSKAEAKRCNELHILQRSGAISELEREPIFHFIINGSKLLDAGNKPVRYRPDFGYIENGKRVVEDVKGYADHRQWALRRNLFNHCYPDIDLRVVTS